MSSDLLSEARRRLDAGDPSSALRLAERALQSGRAAGTSTDVAAAAQLAGECLYVVGDIDGARLLADEALRLDEATADPRALAADLNLLGVLEITVGRPAEAEALLRRSYELRAEALGADDEETIESLNNLGAALWRAGAADEAIALHEEALRRCERALGEDHRRTAETLNALAVKLQSRPESAARASALYERGLASAEAALGPDAELVARLLTNVATTRINDDDLAGAGPLLVRALELHERHFGPTSRWTAYVLAIQGNHAWSEGRYADARAALERAFAIQAAELGATNPETLDTALGLMNVLSEIALEARLPEGVDHEIARRNQEAMDEATALYLPLVALHPDLDSVLPTGAAPDPTRAAEQLRQLASRIASRTAPDAAQAAAIERARELGEDADRFYLAGDPGAAAARLREAIASLEKARDASDTALVEPLQRLSQVLRVGGVESEVLPILRRIAAILADAYGEMHPLAIRALGEVYWQERREYGPAGGRETAARIETLMRDVFGEGSALWRLLHGVLETAREGVPAGTEPEDPPLSARRERILAEPDPLVGELLPDLDATDWRSLEHAFGPAIDTPRHVRLLLAQDERVRDDALDLLGESLLHRDSSYSATPPAVRLVRRLVSDSRVPGRPRLTVFLGAAEGVARVSGPPRGTELQDALGDAPALLASLAASDPDREVREAAAFVISELDAS